MVEPLALGVSLRVVRRRSGLLDIVGVAKLFHQTGLKVSSLVAVDQFLNTVPLKPFMVKTSVMTRTFSLPSLAWSNFVKSIARTSRGREAMR